MHKDLVSNSQSQHITRFSGIENLLNDPCGRMWFGSFGSIFKILMVSFSQSLSTEE